MNALSEQTELENIGEIILDQIPVPAVWQQGLLYALIEGRYRCIATKDIQLSTVRQAISPRELALPDTSSPDYCQTLKSKDTCFADLKILDDKTGASPSHVIFAPLMSGETINGFILLACRSFTALKNKEQIRCRFFCKHVQPYLRNALLYRELQQSASIDFLCRIRNRSAGLQGLKVACATAQRHEQQLALILINIDFLKKINKLYGQQTGDVLLRRLCKRIGKNLRDEDIFFRYGGEEFVVVLPHVDLTGAVLCAERMRYFVNTTPLQISGQEITISISLGVSCRADSSSSGPEELLDLSEQAMKEAKNNGRNQVAVATEGKFLSLTQYLNLTKGLPTG